MSPFRGCLATCALAMVAGLLTAGAAVADTRIARIGNLTSIAAYNGLVAWSDYDPATKRFRLRYRFDGRNRTANVRPSAQAFDVDLGPDERGRFLAVFSRCPKDDCDLYQYRFSTRQERELRGPSSERYDERRPTVWGSRLAFVRDRRGEPYRLRAGRRDRAGTRDVEGGTLEIEDAGGPTGLALQEHRLAFAWSAAFDEEGSEGCEGGEKLKPDLLEMWVADLRSNARELVGRGCGFRSWHPSLTGGALYYSTEGTHRRILNRFDLASRRRTEATGPRSLIEYVQDGSASYFLVDVPGADNVELRRARGVFGSG